jgi:hypothetical protein
VTISGTLFIDEINDNSQGYIDFNAPIRLLAYRDVYNTPSFYSGGFYRENSTNITTNFGG